MPKFYKKLNNSGFSFIPLVILFLAILLVLTITFESNKNNEDVLQSSSNSSNSIETTVSVFPDEVFFIFKSTDAQLLEEQKKRIISKGLTLETYCDEPYCVTKKEKINVSKVTDGFDKNNKNVNFQFGTKLLFTTSEKFEKMKSLEVNDLVNQVKTIKLEGNRNDNWKVQGISGISRNINKLTIEDFNPTPAGNPTYINFKFSGDGDTFYSFIRNLKESGVSVNECDDKGKNCSTFKRSVNNLQRYNSGFGPKYSFSLDVSQFTRFVTLILVIQEQVT